MTVTRSAPAGLLRTPQGRFTVVAVAEAVSWVGLLIGMLFKYALAHDAVGVHVFGPIHGVVFLAYVVLAVLAARAERWDARTTALALLASIPPLCTLWFERWAQRTGRLR